jgi:hypothetical protein
MSSNTNWQPCSANAQERPKPIPAAAPAPNQREAQAGGTPFGRATSERPRPDASRRSGLSVGRRYHFATSTARSQRRGPKDNFSRLCVSGVGVPFHQILATNYNPKHQSLLIQFALGTIVVTGPKAWNFYDRFCSHRATLLKADGKDIVAVSIALSGEGIRTLVRNHR